MAYYDGEKIIEDADAYTVAEFLNMETLRRGKNIQIKCPGHLKRLGKIDTNFGSCMLTEKGYRCFACGVTISMVQMVCEYANVDTNEAFGIIGDALGGREQYIKNGKATDGHYETVRILPAADLEILNISPSVSFDSIFFMDKSKEYIKTCDFSVKPDQYNLEADYYLATKNCTISLKSLLNDCPKLYYTLIKNKACEGMERYQKAIDEICNRQHEASKLLMPLCDGKLDDEVIYDIKTKFTSMYERCQEIYDEIDIDDCIQSMVKVPQKKVIIPEYDLFD